MDLLQLHDVGDESSDGCFDFDQGKRNQQFFSEFSRKAFAVKRKVNNSKSSSILAGMQEIEPEILKRLKRKPTNVREKIGKLRNVRKLKDEPTPAKDPTEEQPLITELPPPTEKSHTTKVKPGKSFRSIGLIKHLLKSLQDLGFEYPTPIQQLAFAPITSQRDVLGSAQTGSGKTAAYYLPLIQRFYKMKVLSQVYRAYTKVVIIVPSRELAIQGYLMFNDLNKYTRLSSCLVIGKVDIKKQESELRNGPDFVIATPGRFCDHLMNSKNINLDDIEVLILDEADRLLQLGFKPEINEILANSNPDRQTLLFSATLQKMNDLIKSALKKPIRLKANPDNSMVAQLTQKYIKLKSPTLVTREAVLLQLIRQFYSQKKVIIFFRTKVQCHRMAIIFGIAGLRAEELHGNLTQRQRMESLLKFTRSDQGFLLATDLAARGLDIARVQVVINFEFPVELMRYIHRVGRTARAGLKGDCMTICDENESKILKKLMRTYGEKPELVKLDKVNVIQKIHEVKRMKSNIFKILEQETEEKEAVYAERDLQKAENLLLHKEEIYNRPKRQWVITEKEKQELNDTVLRKLKLAPKERKKKEKKRGRGGK